MLYHMLPDAGRIQESETERRNRRADRADEEPVPPIYTEADAMAAYAQTRGVEFASWVALAPDFRFRLWNAGHLLGSASIDLAAGPQPLLFPGAIWPDHKSLHPYPTAPAASVPFICHCPQPNRNSLR